MRKRGKPSLILSLTTRRIAACLVEADPTWATASFSLSFRLSANAPRVSVDGAICSLASSDWNKTLALLVSGRNNDFHTWSGQWLRGQRAYAHVA